MTMTMIMIKRQTHDKASRFWNRASLFFLAIWTLGDCVAPGQNDEDEDEDDVVVEDGV